MYGIGGFGGSRRGWGCLDLSAWLLGGMGSGSLGFWWRSFAPHGYGESVGTNRRTGGRVYRL